MTQPPTPPPQDSRAFPSYAGPPVPPPDPAYPHPDPTYPAPGPVYPAPDPAYPAPGAAYPALGAAYPAPEPGYRSSVPAYMAELPPDPAVAGYGYPGVRIVAMSGLAIAALVCSLVPFLFPVAIGLGIGALVGIRRSGERGAGLAIAALAVSGLQTLLVVAFVGIGLSGGFDEPVASPGSEVPFETPEPVPAGDPLYIDELRTGDCFDASEDEDEDDVYLVDCSTPHDGEMIAGIILSPGTYPGDRAVERSAKQSCDREFASYVGVSAERTTLDPDFSAPDRRLWDEGDRLVVCVTWGPDGDQLTGSVRGTKR